MMERTELAEIERLTARTERLLQLIDWWKLCFPSEAFMGEGDRLRQERAAVQAQIDALEGSLCGC